ncbi:MAG: ATP synthase subunit I [Pyrinomonadaceae bacterium]
MSGNSEPSIAEQETIAQLSHKRILFIMGIVAVLGGFAGFIFVSSDFGLGFLLGGILSLINYYWLKKSLKGIFDKAITGDKPQFLATRYFLRYVSFGAVLTIVYLTEIVPVVAVLLGLASFALAIIIEAVIRLFSSVFKKEV